MRFAKYDPDTGEIVGSGDAGPEHLEAAYERGESLILLKTEDPYVFDGLRVDLKTLRIVKDETNDS